MIRTPHLFLGSMLIAGRAVACMCSGPPPSVESSFVGKVSRNWADDISVFTARFLPVERLLGERRVRFEVEEPFRGVQGKYIIVSTGFSGCTFEFLPGENYLVYAVSIPHTTEG
jgi:hypothetical protein